MKLIKVRFLKDDKPAGKEYANSVPFPVVEQSAKTVQKPLKQQDSTAAPEKVSGEVVEEDEIPDFMKE